MKKTLDKLFCSKSIEAKCVDEFEQNKENLEGIAFAHIKERIVSHQFWKAFFGWLFVSITSVICNVLFKLHIDMSLPLVIGLLFVLLIPMYNSIRVKNQYIDREVSN